MAKMNPMFSFPGAFDELIEVHSRRYGTHMRKRRGSVKPALLNEAFQKSVTLNELVNAIAKVIKDALDPYRQGFRDGSMWSRLVGLFKKHLLQYPTPDFGILENFELYDKVFLHNSCHHETTLAIVRGPETSVRIELTTSASTNLIKFRATGYQQTLIGVFLDADYNASTRSECVMLPIRWNKRVATRPRDEYPVADKNQQIAQWPIPAGTKTILVVVKREPCRDGKLIERTKVRGMKVVKVTTVVAR